MIREAALFSSLRKRPAPGHREGNGIRRSRRSISRRVRARRFREIPSDLIDFALVQSDPLQPIGCCLNQDENASYQRPPPKLNLRRFVKSLDTEGDIAGQYVGPLHKIFNVSLDLQKWPEYRALWLTAGFPASAHTALSSVRVHGSLVSDLSRFTFTSATTQSAAMVPRARVPGSVVAQYLC